MQEDTFRGDGLNLYAYVANNPIKYIDPTGHCKEGINFSDANGNILVGNQNDIFRNMPGLDWTSDYFKNMAVVEEIGNPPFEPTVDGKIIGSQAYIDMINDMFKESLSDNWLLNPTQKRIVASSDCLKKIMADVKNNSSQLDNISEDNFIRLCKKFNDLAQGYGTVYEELHYFRNYLNRAPKTLNDMIQLNKSLPEDEKWRLLDSGQSIYHMYDTQYSPEGEYNLKFVSADGMFEAVYRKDGTLLTDKNDAVNMGTYNYCDPSNLIGHGVYDVLPFYFLNNVSGVSIPKEDTLKKYKSNPDAQRHRDDVIKRMGG